jgi:hypothetical protein
MRLFCLRHFLGKNTGLGCRFLLQGVFPTLWIEPASPALAVRFFTTEPPQKPQSIALDRVKGCRLRHRIPLLRVVLMGAGNEISKGKALERKKT